MSLSIFYRRMIPLVGVKRQIFFLRHPEWWVVGASIAAWVLLVPGFYNLGGGEDASSIIACEPFPGVDRTTLTDMNSGFLMTLGSKALHWIVMIVAMMFPLLIGSTRHVAFSLPRKARHRGIFLFLAGYSMLWLLAGIFFSLLPVISEILVIERPSVIQPMISASGFLLAACIHWQPGRAVRMMTCSHTMPIRIQGAGLYRDTISYGLRTGYNCLALCWLPMFALVLNHHSIALMYIVTVVLLFERYLFPHTSKFSSYAWGVLGILIFIVECRG